MQDPTRQSSAADTGHSKGRRHWLHRGLHGALISPLTAVRAGLAAAWTGFGKAPSAARRRLFERSPQWKNGRFNNPQPIWNDWLALGPVVFNPSPDAIPRGPIPIVGINPSSFATLPDSGLRVTWLGHSTTLIEIDGQRFLTDPVWGDRASPVSWAGVSRWHEPPLALEDLPDLDAVLISHDHYDHLDHETIIRLKDRVPRFIVPLGVGSHLLYWGVAPSKITELDWWDETQVGALRITSTPARHSSGRFLNGRDKTLWSGYALCGPAHRVYFSGDTGMQTAFTEIGKRLGPFDVTLFEIGEYNPAWRDWHSGPEQAVQAHRMLGGEVLIPIHWALFKLAPHTWTEPIERALVAARASGVTMPTPRPGEAIEPRSTPDTSRWWPDLPHKSSTESPQVSTPDGRKPSTRVQRHS